MSLRANKFAEREEKKRGGAWRECLYELWLVREWKLFERENITGLSYSFPDILNESQTEKQLIILLHNNRKKTPPKIHLFIQMYTRNFGMIENNIHPDPLVWYIPRKKENSKKSENLFGQVVYIIYKPEKSVLIGTWLRLPYFVCVFSSIVVPRYITSINTITYSRTGTIEENGRVPPPAMTTWSEI